MQFKSIGLTLALLVFGTISVAQTPTSDPINALKNLSSDQQDSLLQSVLGKSDGTGKKTDPRLNTPDTIQLKNGQTTDLQGKAILRKTADGRTLRMQDEDPELRADDTVLIDLTPIELARKTDATNSANGNNPRPPCNKAPGASRQTRTT